MSDLIDYCGENDHFAAANGIELIEVGPGRARARMTVGQRQHNSIGTAHGGALFSLAATTFFAACNSTGRLAVGANMGITCVKLVRDGVLLAEAIEVARTRKLAHGTVRITDESGELVALFHGTAYVKGAPFPPVEKGGLALN
jgi:acyl-CoA thioesterase